MIIVLKLGFAMQKMDPLPSEFSGFPPRSPGAETLPFLSSIVNASADSIISFDLVGRVMTWNLAAERLYGCKASETVGSLIDKLQIPADLRAFVARAKTTEDYRRKECIETIRINQNGQVIFLVITSSPVKTDVGEVKGILISAKDITARNNEEREILGKSEQLRMILENAHEYAIFSLDPNRKITSWNSGARKILGYIEEEIIGITADIIFTPDDILSGAPERETDIARKSGRAADERWHVRKDGSRFWGSGVMMPMRDASGVEIGFVKIFRDQTEEVRAKAALENSLKETEVARAQAEAASRAKDYFFAALSHELRAPLSPISMAAAALVSRSDLPGDVIEALHMILRNVQLQANFIEDLLDVTRISQQRLEIAQEVLNVHRVLDLALEIAKPDIVAKNQILNQELSTDDPLVLGDSRRLQQVIWNLLKNASKFTDSGGTITVITRIDEDAVTVEVKDTGVGLQPDMIDTVFNAFEQGDADKSCRHEGLGLGLAISKAIVEAHGGTIVAESPGKGRGANFRFRLRRHRESSTGLI